MAGAKRSKELIARDGPFNTDARLPSRVYERVATCVTLRVNNHNRRLRSPLLCVEKLLLADLKLRRIAVHQNTCAPESLRTSIVRRAKSRFSRLLERLRKRETEVNASSVYNLKLLDEP